jgi:hypothetical protein
MGHVEVKALQEKYGLSYKDAAHRLYHTEARALMEIDGTFRTISELRQGMDEQIVHELTKQIKSIDAGQTGNVNAEAPISERDDVQEIVEYCESRLRAICNALDNAAKLGERSKIDWIQDGLLRELVNKYICVRNG